MKTKYNAILAMIIFIIGFTGCKKDKNTLFNEGIGQEKPYKSSSFYDNTNNPNDSIGIIHNAICQYVNEQFKENGFVLTNGVKDTLVAYSSFYDAPPPQNYHVQIETILEYIDEYLYNHGLFDQNDGLKSFCYQNDLLDGEKTIDIVYDINDFRSSLQSHNGITSVAFQNQLTNLVFGTDDLEDRILAAKNIESDYLAENPVSQKELMLLSVYRHSSDLWYSHSGNNIDMLPPWVGSDLTGLYSIFWYGATLPNPLGAGIIIGYTALCSAVAAYEFSR